MHPGSAPCFPGVAVEERLEVLAVENLVDLPGQARAHLRMITVADGLDQQVLEAGLLEDFAEDVEDAALERLALDFELLQEAVVDVALAGLLGDQVPEVADPGLADAVDAAEPLLEAVGVPGQLV